MSQVYKCPSFGYWMLERDFPETTKRVIRKAFEPPWATVSETADEIPFA